VRLLGLLLCKVLVGMVRLRFRLIGLRSRFSLVLVRNLLLVLLVVLFLGPLYFEVGFCF